MATLVWLSSKENQLPVQETQVESRYWEDALEEEMANHSSILAWRIPGTGEPGGLQYIGLQKSHMQQQLNNNNLSAVTRWSSDPLTLNCNHM